MLHSKLGVGHQSVLIQSDRKVLRRDSEKSSRFVVLPHILHTSKSTSSKTEGILNRLTQQRSPDKYSSRATALLSPFTSLPTYTFGTSLVSRLQICNEQVLAITMYFLISSVSVTVYLTRVHNPEHVEPLRAINVIRILPKTTICQGVPANSCCGIAYICHS